MGCWMLVFNQPISTALWRFRLKARLNWWMWFSKVFNQFSLNLAGMFILVRKTILTKTNAIFVTLPWQRRPSWIWTVCIARGFSQKRLKVWTPNLIKWYIHAICILNLSEGFFHIFVRSCGTVRKTTKNLFLGKILFMQNRLISMVTIFVFTNRSEKNLDIYVIDLPSKS